MNRLKDKNLTTKQKIGYIRDYYTLHIVAVILGLAAVGWMLNHYIFNPPPRTFINISFYGGFVPDDLRVELAEHLTANLVHEDENYTAVVDNFFETGDPQFDMALTQRMVAMVSARELDIFLMNPADADGFIEAGFARDLREAASAAALARFDDMGVKIIGDDDVPIGLRPAYFDLFRGISRPPGLDFDGWMLIVMTNSERDDAVRAFFDFLY